MRVAKDPHKAQQQGRDSAGQSPHKAKQQGRDLHQAFLHHNRVQSHVERKGQPHGCSCAQRSHSACLGIVTVQS